MYYKHLLNLIIQLKLLTFSLYSHCNWGKCSKCPLHVSQLVFEMEGFFHQKIKVVLMDVIGSKCVWKSRCDWSTHSVVSWESYSNFTCELVWKISGLNLVWNYSYMKFFIHEIGMNFLSGMFNLVPHVKFLICIHFKHVSGVNQVWNRPDLMRIFCSGSCLITFDGIGIWHEYVLWYHLLQSLLHGFISIQMHDVSALKQETLFWKMFNTFYGIERHHK